MKTFFTVVGCIAVAAVLGFAVAGCSNGSTHDHGDICYEHRLIYGIPVIGEVTDTRMTTIKAAIDVMETWGPEYVKHMNYVKQNVKEFHIVPGDAPTWVGMENGKLIAKISVGILGIGGSDEIATALYIYAYLQIGP